MNKRDRFRGCLLGLAVGDAVGASVEFMKRGSFPEVTDMNGGGPFNLPAGAFTDDTSMALCLAASLVECGKSDPKDQLERYTRWYENGYMSSTGFCFDIGRTTRAALEQYRMTEKPFRELTSSQVASNGCIMRLAPVPMFYSNSRKMSIVFSEASGLTTHGGIECIELCRLMGAILYNALNGANQRAILLEHGLEKFFSPRVKSIAKGEYRFKSEEYISGSGYAVECLEAALWCFWKTMRFEDAILMATNLGDDTDTTAAVCGQIAGAYYGIEGIPKHWLEKLVMREEITALADSLMEKGGEACPE